jgi:urease accessory protein
MAGGDRFGVDIDVGRDARLVVTTAAAEKIYRSLGPETAVSIKMSVADSGTLAWLPQETILFDRARLRRTIDVELGGEATLVLAESLIFGRSGMGETMADGLLFDRWRIRRDGLLAYAETVRLDGAPARKLAVPAVANGGVAAGTILLAPGTDVVVGAVRALDFRGEVGASAWNGLAAVRFVATDGATLRHDMVAALAAIRALPRSWLT